MKSLPVLLADVSAQDITTCSSGTIISCLGHAILSSTDRPPAITAHCHLPTAGRSRVATQLVAPPAATCPLLGAPCSLLAARNTARRSRR